ncbi:ferredoxin [Mycobacterium sp.]|uniref:ferredoxin n=1 Tax=Mycobacterium sp. TaxID=1785 RepID=UPI00344DE8FF
MTEVFVNPELCVGHGRCYTLAPGVFDADECGHALVRVANVSGELEGQAIIAEQNCPEGAITLSSPRPG